MDLEAMSPLHLSEQIGISGLTLPSLLPYPVLMWSLEDWRPCTHALTHRHLALLVFCPRVAFQYINKRKIISCHVHLSSS